MTWKRCARWYGLTFLLVGASQPPPLEAQRTYWPVPVESLSLTHHTHVAVRGIVAYIGHELDGDMHVRLTALSGTDQYVVAECLPELVCRIPGWLPWIPKLGDTVTVYGISRRDAEHGYWEVHPVEAVEP